MSFNPVPSINSVLNVVGLTVSTMPQIIAKTTVLALFLIQIANAGYLPEGYAPNCTDFFVSPDQSRCILSKWADNGYSPDCTDICRRQRSLSILGKLRNCFDSNCTNLCQAGIVMLTPKNDSAYRECLNI